MGENVMEDIDFKLKVTRETLLGLIDDLLGRVTGPVERALSTSAMSMENIDQVIILGGGSRIPKVQELLSAYVGQELGKNLNADEAAALGAVYRTADISSGFKVKKFITKDAVVLPIDVDFTREVEAEDGEEAVEGGLKKVRRTLFSRMNPYPQKKIMTFNKHVKDFSFNVNYADLDHLGETEIAWLGSNNITSVLVKGVKEALDNNTGENVETKGVKAHFGLDDSGILTVTSVESVFEKTISVEEQEKREKEWKEATEGMDWSKLGDNIKSFFGTDEAKPEEGADDDKKEKSDDKKDEVKEPKKPKVESVKVELSTEGSRNDVNALDGEMFAASQGKLEALAKADADRAAIELALNELQGYSVDLVDKLEDEEFQAASTDEEREKLSVECSAVSDWLDEEAGVFTPVEEFQTKLKSLKGMAAPVMARLREHKERPEALDMLKQSLNSSRVFLEKSRDLVIPAKPKDTPETAEGSEEKPKDGEATSDDEKKIEDADKDKKKSEKQDEGLFTAKELESLEKKIYEVEKWRDDKLEEQEKQPLSEMPKLTVSLIKSKIQDLDSEVQLLIGKARMIKAERERAKRKAEEEKKKEEEKAKKEKKKKKEKKVKEAADEEGKKTEDTSEETTEPPVPNDDDSTTNSSEEKPADADTSSETTDDSSDTKDSDEVGDDNEDKDETEHTEL